MPELKFTQGLVIDPQTMIFKGAIAVAADFPTSLEVKEGWTFRVTATVTDNDASKTNTGQSFVAEDEIAWNGTNWTLLGSAPGGAASGWTDDGTVVRLTDITDKVGVGLTAPLKKFDVIGSLRIRGAGTSVLTGSINPTASTAVIGVGTLFLTELVVGDRITVTGETRTVTVITDDLNLTVDVAFSDNVNDASPDKLESIAVFEDSTGVGKVFINDLGQIISDLTSTEAVLFRKASDGGDLLTIDTTNMQVHFGDASNNGSAGNPLISLIDSAGNIDNGFFSSGVDGIGVAIGGTFSWNFSSADDIVSQIPGGPGLLGEAALATNPTLVPVIADDNTGIGRFGPDALALISGGIPGLILTELSSGVVPQWDTTSGIVASTTQTQGQGALISAINEVSVVANPLDTVTLPSAIAGSIVRIINNGANTLQIFPASGDNLGAGVDIATALEANETIVFEAYDATNWKVGAETEIVHAEMHDEDNTDAFVINVVSQVHAYHTNGIVSGDLSAGWTFDAGGAGISVAIASIADGGSGEIAVTTGAAHNLAVGDIVSQTNLTDAAYRGMFIVNTITSSTIYEVTATFTATDTGTMDQASVLIAGTGAAGVYGIDWWASVTSSTNNETFDYQIFKGAIGITGTKVRRKFGTAADFGSLSGGGIVVVADGDRISLALTNNDSAGNTTFRNLTFRLERL